MSAKRVGIGEVKADRGEVVLAAYGVGSCVVIILYDAEHRIGALAHCLLPSGNPESLKCPKGAINEAVMQMVKMGARHDKITAKIVGGAVMFEDFEKHAIGKRNVEQTRTELSRLKIPIIAEDVLGNWGRSIVFKLENGEVRVRSFRHGEKIL